MASEPTKFFLCGPPKSGTTWLQLMLDAHPAVNCSGEGHLTDWVLAPLRNILMGYNDQLRQNNDLIYRDKASHDGFSERDFNDIARFIVAQRFARLHARKPQAVVIGDKTPNYAYALGLLRTVFPDSLCVFLARDPRDSVLSMLHQTRRLEATHTGRIYETDQAIFDGYLRKWVEVNRLYLRHRDAYPAAVVHLRYEDLIADEADALRAAFRFLGVATDDRTVAACGEAGRFEMLSGGRARGQADNASFFRRGEAGGWQTELGDRAAALITGEVAEVMAEFGYRR